MSRPHLKLTDHDLRRMLAVACAAAVIAMLAAVVLGGTLLATRDDVDKSQTAIRTNKNNATVAKKAATTAVKKAAVVERKQKRLEVKVVQTRVLVKQTRTVLKQVGILGNPGMRGPRGLPGLGLEPTQAALDAAVARYCANNACSKPPTTEQVYAAIQACADAGGCRGPSGVAGKDGKDAPPVTDQQLDASTARYCDAHGGCSGPQGAPGVNGMDGAPGTPAGPFTFSWDDLNGRTHVCSIDPTLGAAVVQPCSP